MFTHGDIWRAIDQLADSAGYSASGLAKKAGLDPTTFNRSKRTNPEGKPRWPSTESIAKILGVTGTTMGEFLAMVAQEETGGLPFPEKLHKGEAVVLRTMNGDIIKGQVGAYEDGALILDDPSGVSHNIMSGDITWIARLIWEKP